MSTDVSSEAANDFPREELTSDGFGPKLAKLFEQHKGALIGTLYLQLRDHELARDVAQEAFEHVFIRNRKETQFSLRVANAVHLKNYLFRTALNLAANHRRNSHTRYLALSGLYAEKPYELDSPSAEAQCIQEEEWLRLAQALAELPKQARIAFTLVELECMDSDVVAAQLGIRRNTVYQLVGRAYEYLAKALSTEPGGTQ